jgi:hypothetical protein
MTSVIAPKEVVAPKIVGKAIYLELEIDPEASEEVQRKASWYASEKPTKQLIFFPAWTDDEGVAHRSRVMSREISSSSPRAQWTFSGGISPMTELVEDNSSSYYAGRYYDYKFYSKQEVALMAEADVAESTLRHADIMLKTFMGVTYYEYPEGKEPEVKGAQGWTIRSDKPLAVEVTDEDMKLIGNSSTPQAVIRRINKLRTAIDSFPEKLG